ncbi:MAG TPA: alpha/beta hydrolase [Candidatus Binataceae bacterium]
MKILSSLLAAGLAITAASIDGAKIHSAIAGSGEPTVIFVHGWTCDSSTWVRQVPAVARRFRVITLDLPGHGQSESPKSGKFSMDLFARAVEAVRRDARADRIVLVGHSMGTPVIRQYARLYPQHVAALVLVDGAVVLSQANMASMAEFSHRFEGPDAAKNRESTIRGMLTPAAAPALQEKIVKMMMTPPNATASGAMAAMGAPDIWRDDPIDVPVLGLYADKSQAANRDAMARLFPKLEYFEIPGTDHFLMLEKPDEFNRILLEFLNKLK